MRIAFVWTGFASYMADAWRRLAAEPEVELRVWIDASGEAARAVSFDAEKLMAGVSYEVAGDAFDAGTVAAWRPDVLFAVGWRSAVCRATVEDARLRTVPKVCCFDMPWRWKPRCLLAPLALGRFLRRYRAAFVPGAACERYAKWLGFAKIRTGLFSIDTARFSPAAASRRGDYFLYVGRNSAEKRLDDLRAAHRLYAERGGRLGLRLYGKGLEGGFARPEDVPGLMRGAAAFVLPSEFDPWPLVLLEAMAAGCPVIASDRCTNRPELGRNWRVFGCGDVRALARALAEARPDERAVREDVELARRYDCGEWVKRVKAIAGEVTE